VHLRVLKHQSAWPEGLVTYRKDAAMATYHGVGRSNYFAVKDVAALEDALSGSGITVECEPGRGDEVVVLINDCGDSGDWHFWSESSDDDVYVPDLLAEHLLPGEVAVCVHVGNEKMRYLGGYAVATHADGRQVAVHLNDIYDLAAAEFGVERQTISEAEY
jgi:hypothetical protein